MSSTYRDWLYNQLAGNSSGGSSSMQTVTSAETAPDFAVTGGKRYKFTQPLTTLTVSSVENSANESEIIFTAGTGFDIALPESIDTIPEEPSFEDGKSYVINICNNMAVCAAYKPGVTA